MSTIPRYELTNMREKIEKRIVDIEDKYPDSMRYAYEDVLKMIEEIEEKANHGAYNDE